MTYKQVLDYYGTKEKAAAEIGVSVQTVINWEKSGNIPRITKLAIQTLTKGKLKAEK
jgi:DNA-binding XRE family transcriptional regulator